LYKALARLNLAPKDIAIVSGIGCSGRLPEFVGTYGYHVAHGRALPVAQGLKIANPRLTVIVAGGDGDGFAIGGGHVPHAARRNLDLTYIVMDNFIYGLTKGQASPTSASKLWTKSTPYGVSEQPLNMMAMVLSYGATFACRGFSGKVAHLVDLYVEAITHKGFSFVQVLSPCPTFHDTYSALQKTVAPLPEDYQANDRAAAIAFALTEDVPHLGVFYRESLPTYEEQLAAFSQEARKKGPADLNAIFRRYM